MGRDKALHSESRPDKAQLHVLRTQRGRGGSEKRETQPRHPQKATEFAEEPLASTGKSKVGGVKRELGEKETESRIRERGHKNIAPPPESEASGTQLKRGKMK